jgi:acetyl-CoA carboxylase biotin carboxyl carrier protein
VRRRATERQLLVSRIKALAEALEGSDVAEIDLTESGTRLYLRRSRAPETPPTGRSGAGGRMMRPRRARSESAGATSAPPDPGIAVLAPLTGIFYLSPSPSSAAFVEVGEPVQAGQVVCIVEAMKVFNEIKCEVSGTVTAVLSKNGQLVQKGDALIRVQPV